MIAGLGPYPVTKESGVPSLGLVPHHWQVRRLRTVSEMRVSNVDKHAHEGELPVRLCNYIDVYKNDRIHSAMLFMKATATRDELTRFRIADGDVLITKDSESWDDIGVPAVVVDSADDLVCGYHLAMLRPSAKLISGAYLFRLIQSAGVAHQLHVNANGVTRYGLTHSGIKSVWLPVAPRDEQDLIVRFLDHADARIRRHIRAKQRLIALLEEQKQAIIHRGVTRGLDPQVGLKSSGVDWLGEIPEHWALKRARWILREVDERSTTGAEELLSVSHLTGVTPRSAKNVTMFMAESHVGHKVCEPGDLVVNTMWAWMGALGVSSHRGIVSPSYAVYRLREHEPVHYAYLELLLRTKVYIEEYTRRSTGIRASRLRLYPDQFLSIPLVCPPLKEQRAIVAKVAAETEAAGNAIATALREIDLLKEFRARLISDVVTGKLDVREAAAALPDESDVVEEIDEPALGGVPVEGANDLLEEVET